MIARHDYLPFGEEIGANTAGRDSYWGPGNDTVNQKFTGKERDTESGLDYFGARYLSGALGRFTSADPENAGADPSDPQTWNAYSYVVNQPLNLSTRTAGTRKRMILVAGARSRVRVLPSGRKWMSFW